MITNFQAKQDDAELVKVDEFLQAISKKSKNLPAGVFERVHSLQPNPPFGDTAALGADALQGLSPRPLRKTDSDLGINPPSTSRTLSGLLGGSSNDTSRAPVLHSNTNNHNPTRTSSSRTSTGTSRPVGRDGVSLSHLDFQAFNWQAAGPYLYPLSVL